MGSETSLATKRLGMAIVMMVVSITSIVLRFWSRAVVLGGDYRWDDWFALLATIFFLGQLSLEPVYLMSGMGKDVTDVTTDQLAAFLKAYLAAALTYTFGLTFSKLSVLVFYVRIFGLRDNFHTVWKVSVWVAVFLTLAYPAWTIPLYLTACVPFKKAWLPLTPGRCLSNRVMWISSSIFSVIVDIVILLLPLPEVLCLKMKRSKKWVLALAFAIGYCVPALSIGRLIFVIVSGSQVDENITRSAIALGFWSQADPGLTLFAISMVPMVQLCMRWKRFGFRSLFTSRQFPHTDESSPSASSSNEEWKYHRGSKQVFVSEAARGSDESELYLATRNQLTGRAFSEVKIDALKTSDMSDDAISGHSPDRIRMHRDYQVTYDT